ICLHDRSDQPQSVAQRLGRRRPDGELSRPDRGLQGERQNDQALGRSGKAVTKRFPDWAALNAAEREKLSAHAGEYARTLDTQLKAFVAFEKATTPAQGVLGGMPYASKDMFVSKTRRPHGGLAQPLPMDASQQAEVLGLLDHAGAHLIGTTAMT